MKISIKSPDMKSEVPYKSSEKEKLLAYKFTWINDMKVKAKIIKDIGMHIKDAWAKTKDA